MKGPGVQTPAFPIPKEQRKRGKIHFPPKTEASSITWSNNAVSSFLGKREQNVEYTGTGTVPGTGRRGGNILSTGPRQGNREDAIAVGAKASGRNPHHISETEAGGKG